MLYGHTAVQSIFELDFSFWYFVFLCVCWDRIATVDISTNESLLFFTLFSLLFLLFSESYSFYFILLIFTLEFARVFLFYFLWQDFLFLCFFFHRFSLWHIIHFDSMAANDFFFRSLLLFHFTRLMRLLLLGVFSTQSN